MVHRGGRRHGPVGGRPDRQQRPGDGGQQPGAALQLADPPFVAPVQPLLGGGRGRVLVSPLDATGDAPDARIPHRLRHGGEAAGRIARLGIGEDDGLAAGRLEQGRLGRRLAEARQREQPDACVGSRQPRDDRLGRIGRAVRADEDLHDLRTGLDLGEHVGDPIGDRRLLVEDGDGHGQGRRRVSSPEGRLGGRGPVRPRRPGTRRRPRPGRRSRSRRRSRGSPAEPTCWGTPSVVWGAASGLTITDSRAAPASAPPSARRAGRPPPGGCGRPRTSGPHCEDPSPARAPRRVGGWRRRSRPGWRSGHRP